MLLISRPQRYCKHSANVLLGTYDHIPWQRDLYSIPLLEQILYKLPQCKRERSDTSEYWRWSWYDLQNKNGPNTANQLYFCACSAPIIYLCYIFIIGEYWFSVKDHMALQNNGLFHLIYFKKYTEEKTNKVNPAIAGRVRIHHHYH